MLIQVVFLFQPHFLLNPQHPRSGAHQVSCSAGCCTQLCHQYVTTICLSPPALCTHSRFTSPVVLHPILSSTQVPLLFTNPFDYSIRPLDYGLHCMHPHEPS